MRMFLWRKYAFVDQIFLSMPEVFVNEGLPFPNKSDYVNALLKEKWSKNS